MLRYFGIALAIVGLASSDSASAAIVRCNPIDGISAGADGLFKPYVYRSRSYCIVEEATSSFGRASFKTGPIAQTDIGSWDLHDDVGPDGSHQQRSYSVDISSDKFCGYKFSVSSASRDAWNVSYDRAKQQLVVQWAVVGSDALINGGGAWLHANLEYRIIRDRDAKYTFPCESDGFLVRSSGRNRIPRPIPPTCSGPILMCGSEPCGFCR